MDSTFEAQSILRIRIFAQAGDLNTNRNHSSFRVQVHQHLEMAALDYTLGLDLQGCIREAKYQVDGGMMRKGLYR